nr:PREDICTED: uncharacterized protein LOC102364886 [Latimeria chalumnae]|eukprot:XP_005997393.1 PREDICTED: uncharacterized protein LOC102364886 [Latimeria chalumnae]
MEEVLQQLTSSKKDRARKKNQDYKQATEYTGSLKYDALSEPLAEIEVIEDDLDAEVEDAYTLTVTPTQTPKDVKGDRKERKKTRVKSGDTQGYQIEAVTEDAPISSQSLQEETVKNNSTVPKRTKTKSERKELPEREPEGGAEHPRQALGPGGAREPLQTEKKEVSFIPEAQPDSSKRRSKERKKGKDKGKGKGKSRQRKGQLPSMYDIATEAPEVSDVQHDEVKGMILSVDDSETQGDQAHS